VAILENAEAGNLHDAIDEAEPILKHQVIGILSELGK
jgi:hypothetical protein